MNTPRLERSHEMTPQEAKAAIAILLANPEIDLRNTFPEDAQVLDQYLKNEVTTTNALHSLKKIERSLQTTT